MTEKSHPEAEAAGLSQANGNTEQTVYEVGFHIVPTVAEGELSGAVERVRDIVRKEHAEIVSEHAPEKITFAYRIERSIAGKREKYTEGYFGWMKFAVESGSVPAISAALRNTHAILRFIIVETTREDAPAPRRTVFASRSLEGKTIEKPTAAPEKAAEVSEEELDKSLEALVS